MRKYVAKLLFIASVFGVSSIFGAFQADMNAVNAKTVAGIVKESKDNVTISCNGGQCSNVSASTISDITERIKNGYCKSIENANMCVFQWNGLVICLPSVLSELNEGCQTGNCPTGECPTGECPTGQCPTGECPTGECPTGECPTGQCPTGECPTGECPTGECPTEGTCTSETAQPVLPEVTTIPTTAIPTTESPSLPEVTIAPVTEKPAVPEITAVPVTKQPTIPTTAPVTQKPVITVAPTITPTQKPSTDNTIESYKAQVLSIVNQERAKQGLSQLTTNATLSSAADQRAQEIISYFAHTRPNGSSFSTVFQEFGITYRASGENIAYGQRTPEIVMNAWMNSSGHRANILGSQYGKMGVGCVERNGTLYWVQLFTN